MPKLVVFRGDDIQGEVRLRGSVVRIGRDARNEIVLDDSSKAISRFHAEVRPDGDAYVIADLKSRNGTWIAGQRVDSAPLDLGVPVTIGSFELVLEDDVASGVYEDGPIGGSPTVVAGVPAAGGAHSQSGTLPKKLRGRLPWNARSTAIAAILVSVAAVGAIAYVVIRNVTGSTTSSTTTSTAVVTTTTTSSVPAPPPDPRVEDALQRATLQFDARDYRGALATLEEVFQIQPENVPALELKQRAEEALRATTTAPPKEPRLRKVGEIQQRKGESDPEFDGRVARIQSALAAAQESLAKSEFAAAIRHLRAVERDEPAYPGIQDQIREATARLDDTVSKNLSNGQAHEARGNWKDARGWYELALAADPDSTAAREKVEAARGRLFEQARKLLAQGNYAMKSGDNEAAIGRYRAVIDLLSPGDELRVEAQKRLEELRK